jgi:hypothetical protein
MVDESIRSGLRAVKVTTLSWVGSMTSVRVAMSARYWAEVSSPWKRLRWVQCRYLRQVLRTLGLRSEAVS